MTGFGHILDSKFHVFLEKFFQGTKVALPCNFVAVSGTESLFLSQTISKKYTESFFHVYFIIKSNSTYHVGPKNARKVSINKDYTV